MGQPSLDSPFTLPSKLALALGARLALDVLVIRRVPLVSGVDWLPYVRVFISSSIIARLPRLYPDLPSSKIEELDRITHFSVSLQKRVPAEAMTILKAVRDGSNELIEPQWPPLVSLEDGFSYSANGFRRKTVERKSIESLHTLLFPEGQGRIEAREAAFQIWETVTPFWIEAQLQHYGIEFRPDLGARKMKALLLTERRLWPCKSKTHDRCVEG